MVFGRELGVLAYLAAVAGACTDPAPVPDRGVTLSLTASAYRVQQLASGNARETSSAVAAEGIIDGSLMVTSTGSGEQQSFSWSVTIHPDTLAVDSNRTIILPPGNYEFALMLAEGTQQYAGVTTADVSDGDNTVPMLIRPIIGDSLLDVRVVDRLSDFRIAYDPLELSGIAYPQIGVSIDGGDETIFQLSRLTGEANTYFNLTDGLHDVDLRLYDGGLQIGKSLDLQETVVAAPGLSIIMDLVALAAETEFSLAQAGGDAQLAFIIPAEVVEEAGGLNNLEARVSLVGDTNAFQEQVLTLVQGSSSTFYQATATFSEMQYGVVTASLTFTDIARTPIELLGSCTQSLTLGGDGSTQLCNLALRRRAVVGGRLLATVGINVFNAEGEPVSGAALSSNGVALGTTNGGFGSPGYVKVYLPAGQHTLVATAEGLQGSTAINVAPLSINNVVVQLPAAPATLITMSFVDAATGAPVPSSIDVRVEGAGQGFVRDVTGAPRTTFSVTGGSLDLQLAGSAAASPINPVELIFVIKGEGFIDTGSLQLITGSDPFAVVTNMISTAAPPVGVTLADDNSAATDGTGTVVTPAEVVTAPDSGTGVTTTVTIPAGTVVTDAGGAPLTGQLTTQLAYFSPRSEQALQAFPGGVTAVRVNGNPGGSEGAFKSAGMVSIEIRDSAGRVAQNFSGDGLEVSIEVAAGTINPVTNQIVRNGDPVEVWRSDTSTGEWILEGVATAVVQTTLTSNGFEDKTVFTFRARHLSLVNLDWFINVCAFSRQIKVVDDFLNDVPNDVAATFRYRVFIADAMGQIGGYVRDYAANSGGGGFNRVQFQNAPNVNVMRIIVFGSMGQVLANQSFNTAANNGLCTGSGDLFLIVNI